MPLGNFFGRKENERHNYCKCEFVCEVITGPNCDDGIEIRKVEDPSIQLTDGKNAVFIALSDFRNDDGKTITDILKDDEHEFTLAMVECEESKR